MREGETEGERRGERDYNYVTELHRDNLQSFARAR